MKCSTPYKVTIPLKLNFEVPLHRPIALRMIILAQLEWCTMRLPFRAKPNKLTDLEIRVAMAQLQALRSAVEAAERKAGTTTTSRRTARAPIRSNLAVDAAPADELEGPKSFRQYRYRAGLHHRVLNCAAAMLPDLSMPTAGIGSI
jgi:hypothetical protein